MPHAKLLLRISALVPCPHLPTHARLVCWIFLCSAFVHTAVKGEVASENVLFLGAYSAAKDGPVVFSGVGHAVDDDNYLVTKVN